jgi:hypothetical protein
MCGERHRARRARERNKQPAGGIEPREFSHRALDRFIPALHGREDCHEVMQEFFR